MLLPHKVQLAKFVNFTKTGAPVYDAPIEIECYVSRPTLKTIVNPKGEIVVVNAVIYTQTKVDVNDLIIFEDERWPVAQVTHHVGAGLSYYKVVV